MEKITKIIIVWSLILVAVIIISFVDFDPEKLGRITMGEIIPAMIGLYIGYLLLKKFRKKKNDKRK